MAEPTQLFFKRPNQFGIESDFTNIYFDLNIGENHTFSANATERAVEDGSIITDHIQNQLENGSLTGYITNYSIFSDGITSNRAQDVFNLLEELWNQKILVSMVTLFKKYTDVAITNITIDKSDSLEELRTNITFKKVKVVKLQSIEITAAITIDTTNQNNRQANTTVDSGRQ